MDLNGNTFASGEVTIPTLNNTNAGFFMKVSYNGNIEWFHQSTAGALNHTNIYNVRCSEMAIFGFGDSYNSQISPVPGNSVSYVMKVHSDTGMIQYVKSFYSTGTADFNEYLSGGDVSPDGQFVAIVFYSSSPSLVNGSKN